MLLIPSSLWRDGWVRPCWPPGPGWKISPENHGRGSHLKMYEESNHLAEVLPGHRPVLEFTRNCLAGPWRRIPASQHPGPARRDSSSFPPGPGQAAAPAAVDFGCPGGRRPCCSPPVCSRLSWPGSAGHTGRPGAGSAYSLCLCSWGEGIHLPGLCMQIDVVQGLISSRQIPSLP